MPSGTQKLTVRIEDLGHPKRGLLDRIRRKKAAGEASGRFSADPAACGLSEIVFGWEVDRSVAGSGGLVRGRMHPNPLRFFGLFQTTLLFYFESYGDAEPVAYEIYQGGERMVIASGIDSTDAVSEGVRVARARGPVAVTPPQRLHKKVEPGPRLRPVWRASGPRWTPFGPRWSGVRSLRTPWTLYGVASGPVWVPRVEECLGA